MQFRHVTAAETQHKLELTVVYHQEPATPKHYDKEKYEKQEDKGQEILPYWLQTEPLRGTSGWEQTVILSAQEKYLTGWSDKSPDLKRGSEMFLSGKKFIFKKVRDP